MEFLQLEEIRGKGREIQAAMDSQLATKALASKRGARQWRLLQDSLQRLLFPETPSEFDAMTKAQAIQYKFELGDKLRRFYNRPGHMVDYVFAFSHKSELHRYIDEWQTYPVIADYALLVRDLSSDRKDTAKGDIEDLKLYFERVVVEANDAEFRAYAALPDIKADELSQWFCEESPAFKEVMNVLKRHSEKKWIISNQFNPSNKRILDVKVKKVEPTEAIVDTEEYWYLRWWDDIDGSYKYAYRETNRQRYVLKPEGGTWKIFLEMRGMPRTSAPNRWKRRQIF
jgi:hypothetical protein